jgi:hypothetical protein
MWGWLPAAMASLLLRLRFPGTRTMSSVSVHPQHAVHAQSLLSNSSPPVTHHQARSSAEAVESQGGEDAQSFWSSASKLISWSKPPTAAYGSGGTSNKVRGRCERFSGSEADLALSRRLPGIPMESSTRLTTVSIVMCSLDSETVPLSITTARSLKPEQLQRAP